jgi:hypothetical protein
MDKKWETLRKLEDKVQNQVMGVPDRKHRLWRGKYYQTNKAENFCHNWRVQVWITERTFPIPSTFFFTDLHY